MKSLASCVSMRSMPGFEEGRYQPRGRKVEIGQCEEEGEEEEERVTNMNEAGRSIVADGSVTTYR